MGAAGEGLGASGAGFGLGSAATFGDGEGLGCRGSMQLPVAYWPTILIEQILETQSLLVRQILPLVPGTHLRASQVSPSPQLYDLSQAEPSLVARHMPSEQ